jgi:uncharacterized RDD family membrane protein YckC
MAPDEILRIDTPENVIFGYEVVGIGSRFLAALVDTLLIGALQFVVLLALSFSVFTSSEPGEISGWIVAFLGLTAFALLWGFYIFFELLWNGQTPGKRWAGLRVIRRDGTPITLSESIIRNLVRIVDFLPGFYGVGVISMFIDGQSRRLGDMAAGTLVVRDRETVTLESLKQERPSSWRGGPDRRTVEAAASWPLEKLTEADVQLAEDYLHRYDNLANRGVLGAQIATKLLEKMEVVEKYSPPLDGPQVLAAIARLYRAQE